ncbi:MAG: hypothetical protein IJY61_03975 [Candidatus Gastranaerophilales bacterium]|nr:hypothetical protein [Candidatus Gastranaerophilales bacterium]
MEQFLNENMYTIDLGDVNTAPEIIFELSSILDKEEARNKRICLKLGSVDLNQAQLLSIKSLINGIDSTLSCVDTKSIDTEKVALSLGIIVSKISAENVSEVAPAMPYKMADELKEEVQQKEDETDSIVEETDIPQIQNNENIVDVDFRELAKQAEQIVAEIEEKVSEFSDENSIEQDATTDIVEEAPIQEEQIVEAENNEVEEANPTKVNDVQDELDVIFGSTPSAAAFYDMEQPTEIYEEREEIGELVVPEDEYTKEDIELEGFPTKYIKQTIRSGQVINYEGNIVIIGDCHPGCEITAFGDITVWGVLSGIAHAGASGNQKAKVRALKMNAIQLRIANCYSRRPDSLNTVYIEKTNSFTPEEARIVNGEIVVFKMND